MEIKNLTYKEKLKILKDIFDSTNIILTGAYGASNKINGDDISIVDYRDDYDSYEDDKKQESLIQINTGICTG